MLIREPPVLTTKPPVLTTNGEETTNPPQLGLQHTADLNTDNSLATNQQLTPVSSAFAKAVPSSTPPLPFVLESTLGAQRGIKEIFECNRSHWRTDYCVVRGDILVFSKKNRILLQTNDVATAVKVEKVRPYTRKWDDGITAKIWEFTIESVRKPGVGNGGRGRGRGMGQVALSGNRPRCRRGGGGVREEQKKEASRKLLGIPESEVSGVEGGGAGKEVAVGSSGGEGVSDSDTADGGGGGGGGGRGFRIRMRRFWKRLGG